MQSPNNFRSPVQSQNGFNQTDSGRTIPFLIDVMNPQQKRIFLMLVGIWFVSLIYLWQWWFNEDHIVSWINIILVSLLLGWQTLLPGYYFYFVYRMKRPNPEIRIPAHWRIAMVVTKAPSEPWFIVCKTLEAMKSQTPKHDTWLADEDPQPEVIEWCKSNNVKISSRKGIEAYHQSSWPRRTRCKEGNLAYFYDHYGYEHYDFVVQLDADHVPSPGYLEAMIRPFVNPLVGYVAAPSICDANIDESWVVRARAYVEASLHGSLQAGYNDGWAPLCIGSHYAVRTEALEDIGGLGPELAEDHSTTLMMNAHSWRGVFAFDAYAHGDGPSCFTDFLIQEFQWSRSLTNLLLKLLPRYWDSLSARLKFQFLFAQLWYPLYGISLCLGIMLPLIALSRDVPWLDVDYFGFLWRSLLVDSTCLLAVFWVSRNGWFRPRTAKVISWETILFQLVRWPWVLAGVLNAVIAWLIQQELPFRVTPKGEEGPKPLPLRALSPYLILACVTAFLVIVIHKVNFTDGYYFLAILNGGLYAVTAIAIVLAHIRENRRHRGRYLSQLALAMTAFSLVIAAVAVRGDDAIHGISQNLATERVNQKEVADP